MSEDKVQELETAEQSDNSPDKTEDEGRIVVKDDEVYLKVDESDQVAEGTETEPEQGEPGEVIQESAEQEESLDPMYTGKNINDVIEMHQNASKIAYVANRGAACDLPHRRFLRHFGTSLGHNVRA